MANAIDKPKLIKGKEPTIEIAPGITAKLIMDLDRYQNGSILFRIADTDVEVSQGDKKIGTIGMSVGGSFYVQIGRRTWVLDLRHIFALTIKAESDQYLSCEKPE